MGGRFTTSTMNVRRDNPEILTEHTHFVLRVTDQTLPKEYLLSMIVMITVKKRTYICIRILMGTHPLH